MKLFDAYKIAGDVRMRADGTIPFTALHDTQLDIELRLTDAHSQIGGYMLPIPGDRVAQSQRGGDGYGPDAGHVRGTRTCGGISIMNPGCRSMSHSTSIRSNSNTSWRMQAVICTATAC